MFSIGFSFTSMILPHFLVFFYVFPCAWIISPRTPHASLLFFLPGSPIWQISCPQPSSVPALQLRVAFPGYSARKLKMFPARDPQMYFGTVLLNTERHRESTRQALHTHTRLWLWHRKPPLYENSGCLSTLKHSNIFHLGIKVFSLFSLDIQSQVFRT